MEMRKFIVELHTDGRLTWAEYTEPLTRKERDRVCGAAFAEIAEQLNKYPNSLWAPEVKAGYLNGAAHMMDILRNAL